MILLNYGDVYYRRSLKICRIILGSFWTYLVILTSIGFFQSISWFAKNPDNKLAIEILILIYLASCLIMILIPTFKFLKKLIPDLIKWRKWVTKKHRPDSLIAEDVLNLIKWYKNETFCKRLIIYSREKNLIISNQDSEKLLTEFAVILERSILLYSTEETEIDEYCSSEFLSDWLKNYIRKDKRRLAKLGSEFLDEIYILIEQIRVRQKTPENQNN